MYQGNSRFFLVRSAGPDRQFDTPTTSSVYVQVTDYPDRSASVVPQPGQRGSLDLRIEHDRGPFNGLAEVAGTVSDPTGAVVPGATITLRLLSTQDTRTARANAAGQFSLPGLPAGRYQVRISSPGFELLTREFTLQPRDRAVLTTTLAVGAATETVTVTDAPPMPAPARRGARAGLPGLLRGHLRQARARRV